MIEIFFTCWLILLPSGDVHCYCENEVPAIAQAIEYHSDPLPDPPNGRTTVDGSYGSSLMLSATH
jgi:hypothetical protein